MESVRLADREEKCAERSGLEELLEKKEKEVMNGRSSEDKESMDHC